MFKIVNRLALATVITALAASGAFAVDVRRLETVGFLLLSFPQFLFQVCPDFRNFKPEAWKVFLWDSLGIP